MLHQSGLVDGAAFSPSTLPVKGLELVTNTFLRDVQGGFLLDTEPRNAHLTNFSGRELFCWSQSLTICTQHISLESRTRHLIRDIQRPFVAEQMYALQPKQETPGQLQTDP